VLAVSEIYETDHVGGPDQPDYLNAVVLVETVLAAYELLVITQGIEAGLGRVRAERWGPRTVDVDIIAFDALVSDEPELTLPHPRAAERAFVLRPWLDVEPAACLPDGRAVASLLHVLGVGGVRPRPDLALRLP